jgi:hypothetical protein
VYINESWCWKILSLVSSKYITRYLPCTSSLVIDRLRAGIIPRTKAVLFYYCDYNDGSNQTINKVCASLLKQLLCTIRYIPKAVAAVYDDYSKRAVSPDYRLLLELLNSCAPLFSKIYLVLDALDEYEHTGLKKLVAFVSQLGKTKDTCYKIIATSRALGGHRKRPERHCDLLHIMQISKVTLPRGWRTNGNTTKT